MLLDRFNHQRAVGFHIHHRPRQPRRQCVLPFLVRIRRCVVVVLEFDLRQFARIRDGFHRRQAALGSAANCTNCCSRQVKILGFVAGPLAGGGGIGIFLDHHGDDVILAIAASTARTETAMQLTAGPAAFASPLGPAVAAAAPLAKQRSRAADPWVRGASRSFRRSRVVLSSARRRRPPEARQFRPHRRSASNRHRQNRHGNQMGFHRVSLSSSFVGFT